ncbi:MAG: PadR family transcriptional regulator [Ilumatobacteraceae bacterium]
MFEVAEQGCLRDDDGVTRSDTSKLLLGDWACLGILYPARTHGFAIAARLKPTGDIGRIWSLSRPLTYRSLEHLTSAGFVQPIGEEPGLAGGNRTILAATRSGRAQLRKWLDTPVAHLRDLRSELLLKLVIAENCEIDVSAMLTRQSELVVGLAATIADQAESQGTSDVVALWRHESSQAALRFLERLQRG